MVKGATVLVVDGGGRAAALVHKYSQSKLVSKLLAIPGNDLIYLNVNKPLKIFPHLKTTDIHQIVEIAKKEKVDLVDVAQDDAIAVGLVDALDSQKIPAFGPSKLAGQIEWDKAWSKKFMDDFGLPTAAFKVCKTQKEGQEFVDSQKDQKWFIKASGLAAGKGALFAKNNHEAKEQIKEMKKFGKSGETFLIEECLEGEEFSSFAVLNARDFMILGHAQDHKTVYDHNLGPNTGGMGCSSPPHAITKNIQKQIEDIFAKAAKALTEINRPYIGILYLGGIIQNGRVKIIEFNARWGDPEAEVVIPSIKTDFFEISMGAIFGKLKSLKIENDKKYRIAVAACSKGYPIDYKDVINKEIFGLEKIEKIPEINIFSASVKKTGKKFIASGGRLFYIMAQAKNVIEARQKAYNALSCVHIEGNNLHYRTDIGYRDVERFYKK